MSRQGGIVTHADLQDVIARALPDRALGLGREVEADTALLRFANGRTEAATPDMNEWLKVERRKQLANGRLWVIAETGSLPGASRQW